MEVPISIISRTTSFGGDHTRPYWTLRGATLSKQGAFGRLQKPLEDLGTFTIGRIRDGLGFLKVKCHSSIHLLKVFP
jgi:hypothetical protein